MTELHLLNVPFESNYKDTIYFPTLSDQLSYMEGRRVSNLSHNDFTYQRKDQVIRFPVHIDLLYQCNYVQYKNGQNKYMYAFIVDMKYVNQECTEIHIETDVIQTWMFKPDGTAGFTVQPSFVEREHAKTDYPGDHTYPEGLEVGEYMCTNSGIKASLFNKGVIVGSTVDFTAEKVSGKYPAVPGGYYDGVCSGVKYFYFPPITNEVGLNPFSAVGSRLQMLAEAGQVDAVVSVFMCPTTLMKTTAIEGTGGHIHSVDWSGTANSQEWQYFLGGSYDELPVRPENLSGYVPRNKKLLTFPYCYLLMSNNSGGANVYHYEKFKGQKPDFKIYSALTPGMSIRLIPKEYNGVLENNTEGLNLGKLPICSWTNDVYTNWLTQNGLNLGVDLAGAGMSIAVGAAMISNPMTALTGVGMVAGGITAIGSALGQVNQMSHVPPVLQGNINSGDVTYGSSKLTFTYYQMCIKPEYAYIIDEFFDMFGYKTNRVKAPNTNHRENYWYTKTIDVNIDGPIPNKDLDKIKQCYNNGITFWRATATMGDYTASNNII